MYEVTRLDSAAILSVYETGYLKLDFHVHGDFLI